MPEKQRQRASSFVNSLQKLRRTPFGANNEEKHNIAQEIKHPTNRPVIEQTSSTCQEKSSLTRIKSSPLYVNNSSKRSSKTERPWRHVSVPLPTQLNQNKVSKPLKEKDKEAKEDDRSKSRIQNLKLHAPRFSTPLRRNETGMNTRRIFSTQEYTTSRPHSRIPTATRHPEGDLYSHAIHQKEERKSVLSSLGRLQRLHTSLKTRRISEKELDNSMKNSNDHNENMRKQSGQLHGQRVKSKDSPYSYPGPGTTASLNGPPQAHEEGVSNNPVTDYVVRNKTIRSYTMLPVPATALSTPRLGATEASYRRQLSPPLSQNGRPPTQTRSGTRALSSRLPPEILRSREEESLSKGLRDDVNPRAPQLDDQVQEYEQNPMTRKVRVSRASAGPRSSPRQVLSKQPDQREPQRLSGSFSSRLEKTDVVKSDQADNLSQSRFPWTKNSENLRNHEKNADPNLKMQATRAEPNGDQSSSLLAYNRRNSIAAGTVDVSRAQERNRRKDRAERMVQRSSIAITNIKPYISPSSPLDENESPRYQTKTQKGLAHSPPRSLHHVSRPQPHQYWLGRFVTLANAFHYEDSFNQPEATAGFGMISSYSRPLGSTEQNLPDYRIKRAFMVLENACVTDEASRSLRDFQSEYVSIHGDRWMG